MDLFPTSCFVGGCGTAPPSMSNLLFQLVPSAVEHYQLDWHNLRTQVNGLFPMCSSVREGRKSFSWTSPVRPQSWRVVELAEAPLLLERKQGGIRTAEHRGSAVEIQFSSPPSSSYLQRLRVSEKNSSSRTGRRGGPHHSNSPNTSEQEALAAEFSIKHDTALLDFAAESKGSRRKDGTGSDEFFSRSFAVGEEGAGSERGASGWSERIQQIDAPPTPGKNGEERGAGGSCYRRQWACSCLQQSRTPLHNHHRLRRHHEIMFLLGFANAASSASNGRCRGGTALAMSMFLDGGEGGVEWSPTVKDKAGGGQGGQGGARESQGKSKGLAEERNGDDTALAMPAEHQAPTTTQPPPLSKDTTGVTYAGPHQSGPVDSPVEMEAPGAAGQWYKPFVNETSFVPAMIKDTVDSSSSISSTNVCSSTIEAEVKAGGTGTPGGGKFSDPNPTNPVAESYERGKWLLGLLVLQSTSSSVLDKYQDLLREHVVVTLFLTMLVGAGGNAGNQSAIKVIRGLATGRFTADAECATRVIGDQAVVGVLLGAALMAAGFIRVWVTKGTTLWDATAISSSLFLIVMVSVLLGSALPFGFAKAGLDPAHAGTTIQVAMDIVGVAVTCVTCSFVLSQLGQALPVVPV